MADNTNMVKFTIDGREVTVPKGTTVLEAAKSAGIVIPTFCWHPKLKPVGACRMCYVEVEKRPKLEVSCCTEALPDMVVHTDSEKVKQGRRAIIEFTLLNHPLDCPTCDKGGECDLQDLTFAHGIDDSRFDFRKYRFIRDKKSTFDDYRIGPEIIRNQNRCILCYKCVRSNKEIFGEFDIGVYQRGNMAEIDSAPGEKVDNLYSGNLVEICPVGALTNSDWRYKIRVWKTETADSICNFCANGCNIKFWKGRNRIFRTTSRRNDAIDEGWLCDVGRYGYQIANADGRLTTPLVKKGDVQVPVSWEEAIGLIARRFTEIKDKKGGVCIGGLISPNVDSRSLHAFSKFFRTALNSNNVDFRTDYNMLPESYGDLYSKMTSLPFKIADIEKSDMILVIGSDLIKEQPIVNLRVRKAVTKLGAKLFTINPIVTKSGDISTDEIVYKIGSLEALINGICISIINQGLASPGVNTGNYKGLLDPNTVEAAANAAGVEKERIEALAKAIYEAKNITLIVGESISSSAQREKLTASISNLIALAGVAEKGQIGLLSKYSNSKGAEKLGVMPHLSDTIKDKMKTLWKTYPESPGLASDRMILAAKKEELDSLLVIGSNPIITYPDGQFVREGFEKLDFLVVADLFETETTTIADVVLPLSSWAEYNGTLINLEGTVQEFHAGLKPVGHSLPAYEIVSRIAAELKTPLYQEVKELDGEIKALQDIREDLKLGKNLLEVKYVPEEIDNNYPTPLVVIDELHHFGHLTEKSRSLSAFCNEASVEISPAMAEKLGAEAGMLIRVESEVGKAILPVKISELLDNDVALVTRNFSTMPANILQMRKRRIDRVKLSRVEEK
ncbi:MAG: NADH dehydrogenase (quinone) subunit G [candidate division Zixibacteria bacterium HGW-Zixibacteria-1]|nr:MAG: NADH dehydrogenase (quinone) subunit G [candidate division Zixibacteria bacterium HGW-Zixibacteria-1]